MMRIILKLILMLMLTINVLNAQTIHSFKAKDIEGNEIDFSTFKGKKIMIVNTASKCGLTPQFEQLESLFQSYKDSNFVIVGFPSNDFMNQDPGTNEEIAAFCKKNYGVSFLMMEKIVVKGKDKHPIYKFLTQKSLNGFEDSEVAWNFQKYLLDENGKLVKVLNPRVLPNDKQVVEWILQ